jgi:DNA-directed RNA polymerase specialized sigma24 family protein
VLQLCYGDDLPRSRAAAEMGLRDEGLKTMLSRLRAALKACVERRRSHE